MAQMTLEGAVWALGLPVLVGSSLSVPHGALEKWDPVEEASSLLSETLANSLGKTVEWSLAGLGTMSAVGMLTPVPGWGAITRGSLDPDTPQHSCRSFTQGFQQREPEIKPKESG